MEEEGTLSRLSRLLDRALGRLVPEIVASACVSPDPWVETVYFDCVHNTCIFYAKTRDCHYDCQGNAVCTSWTYLSI